MKPVPILSAVSARAMTRRMSPLPGQRAAVQVDADGQRDHPTLRRT
jgi:hypothetical protein